MATDATGTPTSPDNIPTYNTSADAPSGNGFNNAIAAIQTIITQLKAGTLASGKIAIAALVGYPADSTKVLKGDGTWSALSGSPSGAAGGSLAGTYPNPSFAAGSVGATELAASAVTPSKIGTHGAGSMSSPASAASLSNASYLMMGLAGSITPVVSGKVSFFINGIDSFAGNVPYDRQYRIRYGTGAAPANAAAEAGTLASGTFNIFANGTFPIALIGFASGLVVGTPYWFDASCSSDPSSIGNTTRITTPTLVATEVF